MEWHLGAMGNARGTLVCGGNRLTIEPGTADSFPVTHSAATLEATGGKFADSEDSFVYWYCTVDPRIENFTLSADVCAAALPGGADQQSGWGILVADTDASDGIWARHRNLLLAGNCCSFGQERQWGVRLVAGNDDGCARIPGEQRVTDCSRVFPASPAGALDGGSVRLSVEKTDAGLIARCNGEAIFVTGCDFLCRQDPATLHVGFAAARNVAMSLRHITWTTSPGCMSHTPEGTVAHAVAEYPFPASVLAGGPDGTPAATTDACRAGNTLFAAPNGAPQAAGTEADPLSLEAALAVAGPGTRIILLDGIYEPTAPYVVPAPVSGTVLNPIVLAAAHPRACVLDGSSLPPHLPLFALAGSFWHLTGIVFAHSPLAGLTICGNQNRVENCEFRENGDSGLLITAPATAERSSWPQRNYLCNCDSHHNRDTYGTNADGFAAKLRVGPGNIFYGCMAHHNVDDGFDLYTKGIIGPTHPVELDSCIAYENGRNTAGNRKGTGFKLGGENLPVAHAAWNCIAYGNADSGFSSNSNPRCELHFCTSVGNGASHKDNVRLYTAGRGRWVTEALLEKRLGQNGGPPKRDAAGFINLAGDFAPKRFRGHRMGADIRSGRHLLFHISSLGGGGAKRVTCRLSTQLSKRHRVWIGYTNDKEDRYPISPDVGIIDMGVNNPWRPKTIFGKVVRKLRNGFTWRFALRRVIRQHGIETTISMLPNPNFVNTFFGRGRRIISERNDPSQKSTRYFRNARLCARFADYSVFQSNRVSALFSKQAGAKSCIIRNPVEVDCIAQETRQDKIVTAGRLVEQKNHMLLLDAFALFAGAHPTYQLCIFGKGDLEEELRAHARELGIDERVSFEGFREDINAAISDAKIFVLSSDYEGLSNALIEAMLMGIACISTACTGSDELIHDGVDGLLTPVGDAPALAAAMARLADDDELRATLERNALARQFEFSPELIAHKWERIL